MTHDWVIEILIVVSDLEELTDKHDEPVKAPVAVPCG